MGQLTALEIFKTAIGVGSLKAGATMATRALNSVASETTGDGFEILDEYARLAKLFPQIEHAATPVPAQIGWGRQDHPFGDLERAVEAGTYRLRSGVMNPAVAGLIGPIVCHGSSMGNVLPSGSFVWFDPTEPAKDGDLVVFRYSDAWLREAIAINQAGDETFRNTYKGWCPNIGIKLLVHHRARHVLLGDDAVPMRFDDGHRLIGVVRHVRDSLGVEMYV